MVHCNLHQRSSAHTAHFLARTHRWQLIWCILNPSCWFALKTLKMQMCLRDVAAYGAELLHDHPLMRLHKAHGLRGCRTCRHQPDTSNQLGLWRDQEHSTCPFVRPIPCVQTQARCSTFKLCALPCAAAGPSDPSPQEVVAIDVEFVHYTPAGAEPQSAAAYVCLVDRDLNVLLKSFINPGLPSGARLNGGVRLADIKGAPTLAAVGGLHA